MAKTQTSTAPLLPTPQEVMAIYRAGRLHEAMTASNRLLSASPQSPQLLLLAGSIAKDLGKLGDAVSFFERALAQTPDRAEIHYSLGNALTQLGRAEEAIAAYRRAASLRPDIVPIHNNLGIALQSLERWDEAIAAYRQAVSLAPTAAELHRNLGLALDGAGRRGEAIVAYCEALSLKPDWPAIYQTLATVLLEEGEARSCIELCDTWLKLQPGMLEAIGLKAMALDEIGDRETARSLVDLDRFIRITQFDAPPPGFASLPAFNEALSQDVLGHPTLAVPGESEPHYNGPGFRTTRELFGPKTGPWAALEKMFADQVVDYLVHEARPDPSHPYLAHRPARWRVSAVATVLDRQSALAPHVHYDGYVSGVYYCQLPEITGIPGQGQAGWFEIGRPQRRFHRYGNPEIRAIRPREGMMILFPSYFLHNTVPFESEKKRISIAFDAIPVTDMPDGLAPGRHRRG